MSEKQQNIDTRSIEHRRTDRRQHSWATFHGSLFRNRRRQFRRDDDHVNAYQDWHGHVPLAATVLIILLCFVDAFFTTILLSEGAVEMNILMDWLIRKNIHAFTIVKMAVTGIALVVLVMHYNFRIYRFIAVKYVIFALIPAYSLLILHELRMLASF